MTATLDALPRDVRIQSGSVELGGTMSMPAAAKGLVLFAHGSGSSRFSPRNAYVATHLQRAGLGTLLFDLLSPEEEQRDLVTRELRFDISLLARRLADATQWLRAQPGDRETPIGYFGASTGSAAALIAASDPVNGVAAVVSRGGRPDLAGQAALARVTAPTLLIVGGADGAVIDLNRAAYGYLAGPKELAIVPGASHLFEERGTLEQVAKLAAHWFVTHLGGTA